MKIQLLSDLHVEFGDYSYQETDCDVIVLAGDIHTKERGVSWALEHIKGKPVIYVFGNHEFYGATYPKLLNKMKQRCIGSNIHILENDALALDGVNFLGCTLWTDFELFGDAPRSGYQCQQTMNDYKKITRLPGYSKLRSMDVALINKKSQLWLIEQLKGLENQVNVVVTHHGPSIQSVPEHYKEDTVTSAYVSNFENIMKEYNPMFWLHGHLHNSSDYQIGNCRVICNPRGYPQELNPNFNPTFTFEI